MGDLLPPGEPADLPDDAGESRGSRDILRGSRPKEILARLIDGDPLELEARCLERIRTEAWLLDLTRLHLRAVARIAIAAPRYRGEPPLARWIEERIDYSITELLAEDREVGRVGVPPAVLPGANLALVLESLGIEPAQGHRACNAFNVLPLDVRRSVFAVVVDGKSIHRWVAEGNGPPHRVREQLKVAFLALGRATGPGNFGSLGDDSDDT